MDYWDIVRNQCDCTALGHLNTVWMKVCQRIVRTPTYVTQKVCSNLKHATMWLSPRGGSFSELWKSRKHLLVSVLSPLRICQNHDGLQWSVFLKGLGHHLSERRGGGSGSRFMISSSNVTLLPVPALFAPLCNSVMVVWT